ncbi:MAG: helix-turn-helix domain-containing protein [Elusimicrobia bacterium]|nr:helix-turn-helix domain-containing protein [Elusimicrobiota bacterium]
MSLDKEPDPLRRIPTKHTTALRAEIGPILRAARLKRGQSLEAVAQQTRISKRFLEALEENRFEQFPAVVYLRGFLKGYCEHLDVNFDEIWTKLNAAPEAPAAPGDAPAAANAATPAPAAPARTPAPKAAATPAPAPAKHAPAPAHGHAHPAAAAHGREAQAHGSGATGAIVLAVLLAIGLAVFLFKDQDKRAAEPSGTAPAALQPMPRSVEPKLVVRLKNDAWLRVSVDGVVAFEGRAPREAVQEWKPVKFVELRTTEPAALELTLNGLPVTLGAPGPDGQYRVEIP